MSDPANARHLSLDYLEPGEKDRVRSALQYLQKYKARITEPTHDHSEQMLELLTGWQAPARMLLGALLHQVIEHQGALSSGAGEFFTPDIVTLAQDLKVLDQPPVAYEDTQGVKKAHRADRLRHLFVTAYTDLDLTLLTLASHIVRMRGIGQLDDRNTQLLAEDNQAIFLPLLEMLGMWQLRRELGDLGLEILNPGKIWDKIRHRQDLAQEEQTQYWQKIEETLKSELKCRGVDAEVRFHTSPPSSIYRRILRGEALEELVRKVKVDVIASTKDECYQALGVVHTHYPPMPGRPLTGSYFRDLIQSPKFNGHQALITVVGFRRRENTSAEASVPIEFRIRTQDMETMNMYGIVAARFLSATRAFIENAWWENREVYEFIRTHPAGSSTEKTYVFSPTGEVYHELPQGSTPIDYAYRVHSEIGNHCKRIWVNGRPAAYDTKLHNGDLVDVEADPAYPGPLEQWLSMVKTSTAKTGIRRALKRRRVSPHTGREIIQKVLTRELRAYRLPDIPADQVERFLEKTARYFDYPDVTMMYVDIANPAQAANSQVPSPHRIVSRLIADQLAGHIVMANGDATGIPEDKIRFAQCYHDGKPCRVEPGVPIVGRIERPQTYHKCLVVYRRDCPKAPKGEATIPLAWRGERRSGGAVRIVIQAVDKARLLHQVLHSVYDLYDQGLYLQEVHARVSVELSAHIELKITSQSHSLLLHLQEKLNQLKDAGVISHTRVDPLSPVEKILLASRESLPNPYTTHFLRDARLFKGREAEIERITTALRSPNLLILYGAKRVGKTSLLQYMQNHILHDDFVPVFVTMQGMVSYREATFWHTLLMESINEVVSRCALGRSAGRRLRSASRKTQNNAFEGFQAGVEKAKEFVGGRRLLIMIDDLASLHDAWPPEEASRVISQLKAFVESQDQVAFILCIDEGLYKAASSTQVVSWPLLRTGIPLRLDYLDRRAAIKLIQEPLGELVSYDDESVEQIVHLTGCHPYYLQFILHKIITHMRRHARRLVTPQDVQAVVPHLLDAGEFIFQDFLEHGEDVEQAVLVALASISEHNHLGASASEIQTLFRDRRLPVEEFQILKTIDHLHDAGVLRSKEEHGVLKYHIRVPLFGQWLRENRSLSTGIF